MAGGKFCAVRAVRAGTSIVCGAQRGCDAPSIHGGRGGGTHGDGGTRGVTLGVAVGWGALGCSETRRSVALRAAGG